MYNGSDNLIPLTKFPFKLRDANDRVKIADDSFYSFQYKRVRLSITYS